MDPKIPWYQSAILRQQIVQVVAAVVALLGINTGTIDLDATTASIFAGIAAVVGVWTFVTRLVKPAPNLTAVADNKQAALEAAGKLPKQGGFFRVGALLLVLAIGSVAAVSVATLPGCAGTSAAYKSAQSLPDTAYVVTEHYAAVVHEAADLAALPGTPDAVKAEMKRLDAIAKPLVLGNPATGAPGLGDLAQRYADVKNAQTEAELQSAINRAVEALAQLVNAVKTARR